MKTRNIFLLCPAILMGILLTFTTGCKDEKDNDAAPSNSVADGSGNYYQYVTIGTQTWLSTNLKTTKYNDGTPIENPTNNNDWSSATDGAYAWYNNDIENAGYGALYNWYAVNTNKLCPPAWRVSTNEDWELLTEFLGGMIVAGGKLKSTNTFPESNPGWKSPNTNATDDFNFSALPGGARTNERFNALTEMGYFWTSSIDQFTQMPYFNTLFSGLGVLMSSAYGGKTEGLSVRCVKE
ncbi:MAG: fibrobacter succinogenes major paralogous domain-containing protein [Salinivirgaceae bacterium]|nr:fibrobacter succinogenes major paralogous domain-containing protein [Salinivirgaceae bacterium]